MTEGFIDQFSKGFLDCENRKRNSALNKFLKNDLIHDDSLNKAAGPNSAKDYACIHHPVLITKYKYRNRITNFEIIDFVENKRCLIYPDINGQLTMFVNDINEEPENFLPNEVSFYPDKQQALKQFQRLRNLQQKNKAA